MLISRYVSTCHIETRFCNWNYLNFTYAYGTAVAAAGSSVGVAVSSYSCSFELFFVATSLFPFAFCSARTIER